MSIKKNCNFVPFHVARNFKGLIVDMPTFDTKIIGWASPLKPNSVPALEALTIIQYTEGHRVKSEPVTIKIDSGAANCLTMLFADNRCSLDKDYCF